MLKEKEKELIKKVKEGDLSAFEEIISNYEEKIYNFAFHLVGNEQDAKDIAQEAIIKAYLSIKSFRGRAAFSTWLYRIISNTFQDELKKAYRRHEVLDNSLPLQSARKNFVEDSSEKDYLHQVISKAISKLSPRLSRVLILRDLQSFSYQEIAEIERISLGTVKSRVFRAREILRKRLKEDELF